MPNTFWARTSCWVWDFVFRIVGDSEKDISPLTQLFYLFSKLLSLSMFTDAALKKSKSMRFQSKESIRDEAARWLLFEDDDPDEKFFGLTQKECREIVEASSAVQHLRQFLTVVVLSNGSCLKLTHPTSKHSAFWFFGRDVLRQDLQKITVASNDDWFDDLVEQQKDIVKYVRGVLELPFEA